MQQIARLGNPQRMNSLIVSSQISKKTVKVLKTAKIHMSKAYLIFFTCLVRIYELHS